MASVCRNLLLSLYLSGFLLLISIHKVSTITHMMNLLWSEKSLNDGGMDIKGIPGDPVDWVNKTVKYYSISYYSDDFSRQVSRRVALGFIYNRKRIFFNDGGFKQIYGIILAETHQMPYTYNVTMYPVYYGSSSQVNGLAVDWLSGSVYWTDSLYRWIIVANSSSLNVYTHLVVQGLDRPMGIAVYPQKGLLFWTDQGAVPKIERCTLSGKNRTVFISGDIDKPMGLTIDYEGDRLYWVDDARSSIESVDMLGGNRLTILLTEQGINGAKLFGIATFRDYIFIADQNALSIRVFNKTTDEYISQTPAGIFAGDDGIPYDVMMYDEERQKLTPSDCDTLNCEDMCISDGGSAAHCMCRDGYKQDPNDTKSCIDDGKLKKPQYVYSVGESLCSTNVNIADTSYTPFYVDCFWNSMGHQMSSLGFHVYAELIFFSDQTDSVIHSIRVDAPPDPAKTELDVLVYNIKNVKGLEVDWIGDNLYYMDGDTGTIYVSKLTGQYPRELVTGIVNGKSMGVNPLSGLMYWATDDTIFEAHLDGTNIRRMINLDGKRFDGMVIDIRRDTLYWVDDTLPGVRSCFLNGTGLTVVLQSNATNQAFHDVTVYQDYFAWTTGSTRIYFGARDYNNTAHVKVLRGIMHYLLKENRSHDIITYDEYLQPPLPIGERNPCESDDPKFGCSQLCLLKPNRQRVCSCSYGYRLSDDGQACVSDKLQNNFLMFIDGTHQSLYQLSFLKLVDAAGGSGRTLTPASLPAPPTSSWDSPQGIALMQIDHPTLCAFDTKSRYLYWFDQDMRLNSISRKKFNEAEHTILVLEKAVIVTAIDTVPSTGEVLYTDSRSGGGIYMLNPDTSATHRLPAAGLCNPIALAVNQLTNDIYWVDSSDMNDIALYTCSMETGDCMAGVSNRKRLMKWTLNYKIKGLAIDILSQQLLIYTESRVYRINPGGNDVLEPSLIVDLSSTLANLSSVAGLGDSVFYTDWNTKAVYQFDTKAGVSRNVTAPFFSRITDLKAYRSKEEPVVETPESQASSGGLSAAAKGGIIGGSVGGGVLLLLLLLLLILLLVFLARRRKKPPPYKAEAHDNPTYLSHSQIYSVMTSSGAIASTLSPPPNQFCTSDVEKDPATLGADCCKVPLPGPDFVAPEPETPVARANPYYPADKYDTINSMRGLSFDDDDDNNAVAARGSESMASVSEIAIGFPRQTLRQNSNLSVTYSPNEKSLTGRENPFKF